MLGHMPKKNLFFRSWVVPLSRAGPIANAVTKAQMEWITGCVSAPPSENPLSLHVLLDQESHRSNHVSLFTDVKACKMSNHVKSPELYLRGELQRQWDLKIKTSKLHLEKKKKLSTT